MNSDNDQQNYFELFGIKPTFRIDKQAIEKTYLQMQALFHPDRFATASAQERRIAAQQSAYLNEAHDVLMDACARADYLLQLQGCAVNPDASMSDNDFLMEQMEYRERLEEVAMQQSSEPAVALCTEIERQNIEINNDFEQAYDTSMFDTAKSLLARMRFMKKLQAEAKAIITSKESF